MTVKMKWSERKVGYAVMHHLMERAAIVVPNCNWTGYEADLLVVTRDLRLIDIEIKVDRSDLKADGGKDKWKLRHYRKTPSGPWSVHDRRVLWPDRVWKHYYVMPEKVWDDSLLECISPASGIILIRESSPANRSTVMKVVRGAKPNRGCPPISQQDAFDIGRLANLRMWDMNMKIDQGQRVGVVKVSTEIREAIRQGFPPSPEFVGMMSEVVVLDVKENFMEGTVSYFCYSEKFDVKPRDEVIPEYVPTFQDGKILEWRKL